MQERSGYRIGTMQEQLWIGVVAALLLAIGCGVAERRRNARRDLDKAGFMPWPLIQIIAVIVALILVSLALNLHQ
jgi:hypothetical protein